MQDGIIQDGSKIKISINRFEKAQHKVSHGGERKRKRDDTEQEYVAPKASNRNRRLKNNPQLVLNDYLKHVVEAMYQCPEAPLYFHAPVDEHQCPGYGKKMQAAGSSPVDLGSMRDKVRKGEYMASADLKEDMDKLVCFDCYTCSSLSLCSMQVRNSEIYNGPDHPVTSIAGKIRDVGLHEWTKHHIDIAKIDSVIFDQCN